MPINAIQFQPGLSLPRFQALYGTEQQCESALVAARWPQVGAARTAAANASFSPAMARDASSGSALSAATKAPASWAP